MHRPLDPFSHVRSRRGSALVLVLVLTVAIGALALSAIFMGSNAGILGRYYDREQEFRYVTEAGLAMGKSRLNNDVYALADSGDTLLISAGTMVGADGQPIPGLTVNVYAGPTGSTSGQFGRFASVVAEARDGAGSRFVRRLELAQENFARFAYWSNKESNNGNPIYFGSGDNLWGPVWSNDQIKIHSSGATFHSDVGTASTILNPGYATFNNGYRINQKPIELPDTKDLSRLEGYARAGSFEFKGDNSGDPKAVRTRIEFVAIDLNADGDSTDVDEGFFRVFEAKKADELRADFTSKDVREDQCGAFYDVDVNGVTRTQFFPVSVHGKKWFRDLVNGSGGLGGLLGILGLGGSGDDDEDVSTSFAQIMSRPGARCFPAGDPHLVAVQAKGKAAERGGDGSTFVADGELGKWVKWPGAVDPRLAGRADKDYLFPLFRGLNPSTKGVIYVDGSVAVSGVLRGRVTLYSKSSVVFVDDLRYATDPAAGRCADMLGVIAAKDVALADNSINSPQDVGGWKGFDDSDDLFVHGVMMALSTSFFGENYNGGAKNVRPCGASNSGRGCLFLTGGIIQDARGAVGTVGGTGYVKRYSYDQCALFNPPPYFPTTGRYIDNRYYEIDPVRFDADKLFESLQPER